MFTSIQGEAPYVGVKQLFIRFCGCNLNCDYCDTEFDFKSDFVEYSVDELVKKINEYNLDTVHSISLTGGEPLLSVDFLKELLPKLSLPIYLETNATLCEEFLKIKEFVDIVSADIKLKSATGIVGLCEKHDAFFENCSGIETFAKVVFDDKITDLEIEQTCYLAEKYNIELILQPMMIGDKMAVSSDFASKILDEFLMRYRKVRLIPQVHKFLSVR